MNSQSPEDKASRKRAVIIGLVLGGLALFMYVSIIVKTAMMGP